MTVWTPRPYQRLIEHFGLNRPRGNVFASPGMGKTTAAYSIFDGLRMMGEARRALVLAPKRVALSSWPKERDKWDETFGHLKVAAAIGTPEQRLAALRAKPDILTVNYDNVPWLIEQYGDDWPFDTVFADESTRLKGLRVSLQPGKVRKDGSVGQPYIVGQGSARAKALAHVAHTKVRNWYNLTGSPAPNGIVDLWGQQWFIDGGRRLGRSFDAFSQRWFRAVPGSDGYSNIEPLGHAQGEIEKLMAQTSITVEAKDWFPLKDVIERNVLVQLPAKARAAYREMEKEAFAEIQALEANRVEVEAVNAGSKINKCLQIANGAVFHDTETRAWVEVHDEKIEALRSIVEETNGENLLVTYQFRPDLERILKAFPKAVFLGADPRIEDRWNEGKIRMLVCHPASAGHGLSLQHGGRILVDFSSGWNMEFDEQVIERIGPTRQYQSGYDRSVFRYRIVAEDTVEEHSVIPRLRLKMSVQDSLKNAMKARKNA
jgi:SNF2 family DNA or RNA helicase